MDRLSPSETLLAATCPSRTSWPRDHVSSIDDWCRLVRAFGHIARANRGGKKKPKLRRLRLFYSEHGATTASRYDTHLRPNSACPKRLTRRVIAHILSRVLDFQHIAIGVSQATARSALGTGARPASGGKNTQKCVRTIQRTLSPGRRGVSLISEAAKFAGRLGDPDQGYAD